MECSKNIQPTAKFPLKILMKVEGPKVSLTILKAHIELSV